ncbi:MAG: hypothetical protein LBD41_05375 [Clostridiales Family XIII bacterium]|jgi:putative membrane fusion protein|nr:hypothetical protein [Clostridiales Family XIII bacterium]
MAKRKTNLLAIIIFTYIILLIIFVLVIFILPFFQKDKNIKTDIIKYGKVKISTKKNALLIRNEKLYVSSLSGRIVERPNEGEKIRKGESLFFIDTNVNIPTKGGLGKNIRNKILKNSGDLSETSGSTAQNTRVLSYWTDGNEKNFKHANIEGIMKKDINKNYEMVNLKRKYIKRGDPFYKLVDNSKIYFVFFVDKSENTFDTFKEDEKLMIRNNYIYITGIIKAVYEEDNEKKIVVESNMYFPDFNKKRKIKLEFVFDEFAGLKIMKDSVVKKRGKVGVYKKYLDGSIEFVPIKILGENEKECVIVADRFYDDKKKEVLTVDYYDKIVRNASSFK